MKLLFGHKRLIFLCFIAFFVSSFGQTSILSLWNDNLFSKGLHPSIFGACYGGATFLGSLFLPKIGAVIDKYSPLKSLIITSLGLSSGFLLLAGTSYSLLFALIGIFLVRCFGQVSVGMVASVLVGIKFGKHRGKIISLTQLGRPLAEGILPSILLYLNFLDDIQKGALALLGLILFFFIPFSYLSLKSEDKSPLYEENSIAQSEISKEDYSSALLGKRGYLLFLSNAVVPLILTGLFFLNPLIIVGMGWTREVYVQGLFCMSLTQLSMSYIFGVLVDHFSPKAIFRLYLLPLIFGLILLLFPLGNVSCYGFFVSVGLSISMVMSSKPSFFAQNVPANFLGKIKARDSQILVMGTSLAPFLLPMLPLEAKGIHLLIYLFLAASLMALCFQYFFLFTQKGKVK